MKKKTKKQSVVLDNSYFDNVFRKILNDTNNELNFEKAFDRILTSANEEVETINNYSIKLQGKLGKNLNLTNDIIVCKGRKNCKINLDLEGEKLTGYKYVWKYPNGEEYLGINPEIVEIYYLIGYLG